MRITLIALLALASSSASFADSPTWQYPAAARGNVVDDYHGTKVADPYRWLEDLDSPETRAWVETENKLTFGFLEKLPQRAYFRERLTTLWNYPRIGVPFKEGGRYFFSKNSGLQNQAVFYVQEKLGAEPRVLIDPNTLAKDGTVALAGTQVSKDGKWVAYSTAAAGSDWNEIRVRAVDDGKDASDVIAWVKFSGPSWTKDNGGFFYSRYPAATTDEGTGKTFSSLEHQRMYYHKLGTPQSADRLIYERADEPQWFVNGGVTEDGKYLIVTTSRGSAPENLLSYVDLGNPEAPTIDAKVVPIVTEWDAEYAVVGNRGSVLFVVTNLDAPRRRIIAIDTQAPARANWKTLVPEGEDTIDSVAIIGGRFVVKTMHDASSRLAIYSLEGKAQGHVALPGIGTVGAISGREDETEFFYNFVSFTTPATNFRHDVATNRGEIYQAPQVAFNPADYETKQVFYTSKDGTRVPMFISHKKGLKIDANTPALLYGYGGFDVSLTPAFSVVNLVWMEAGGVYAMPNLRGGGEYGKAWHESGTKERKQNVFDDFIAAAEWLFANKYTSPAKLVLSGGSNGGLLVGATVNQRPDLCRVAWPAVGVMDMLRFHKFTIGYAWVNDYGSSDDAAGFKYLSAYSPLHTAKAGVKYPAVLVTTADHDDRVHPAHSFKYTAELQAKVANTADSGPIMIRIETKAGHGAGKPTSKMIEEAADKLGFAAHFLGLNVPAKP
ncbi:prolyl oligopeptidase family serine peptidase [Opitutus sp. ER46]|uniref:prolyl oligopeptidase family serine peptidase n=1 Tax=Opitutus sp. ER46 TaxID=2161864 RepID=UPI000D323B0A|nr:prolyl oligopeptidase family serine peptidase [Opitutus sp. ER46]PTX91287.1 S9 family peptidase [Opitutus sp. ER46]